MMGHVEFFPGYSWHKAYQSMLLRFRGTWVRLSFQRRYSQNLTNDQAPSAFNKTKVLLRGSVLAGPVMSRHDLGLAVTASPDLRPLSLAQDMTQQYYAALRSAMTPPVATWEQPFTLVTPRDTLVK